ncbi:hypothetical protein IJG78_01020 [Candidatus Saccharibacteria bacterium]|nr:hypothetical protein [Candidatus Saccharibacteria bacterium]
MVKQAQLPLKIESKKGIPAPVARQIFSSKNKVAKKVVPKKKAYDRLMEQVEEYDKKRLKQKNDEKAAVQRKIATRYQEIKSKVFEMEMTNNSRVIVFSSGPGWYKIGGKSALIYVHMLAPRIGIEPSIKIDRDFYSKFEEGIVSIRHLDLLKENFEKIGVKVESETSEMVIFKLEKPVTKTEMRTIKNIRDEREQRVNQIVETKKVYPSISALMRKINQDMRNKYIHCAGNDRTYIIEDLAKTTLKSTVDLTLISNGVIEARNGLLVIYKRNEELKAYLMNLMELGIFEVKETLRMENDLVDVNTMIKAELKKIGGKNNDTGKV